MNTKQPRHRWSRNIKLQAAGWYLDPWDLSGEASTERWWNGLIWTERTRQNQVKPVSNSITSLPEERIPND